jgi:hypothetical protein
VSAQELRAPGQAGPGARMRPGAGDGVRAILADLFPAPAESGPRAGPARWWALILVQVAAVALGALAMLARMGGRPAGWATDFRYPVRRLSGPNSAWEHTASLWLRHCEHKPGGTITVTFRDWWGPARLATTFSCSSLRR